MPNCFLSFKLHSSIFQHKYCLKETFSRWSNKASWFSLYKLCVSGNLSTFFLSYLTCLYKSRSVKSLSRARLFATPWTVACTKVLHPWDFQGKCTGVGCHFLLQGIFPTQGLNPGLSPCRQMLYHLSHQGRVKIIHSIIL